MIVERVELEGGAGGILEKTLQAYLLVPVAEFANMVPSERCRVAAQGVCTPRWTEHTLVFAAN